MKRLTDRQIKAAKPRFSGDGKPKPYLLNDGDGLCLQVQPSPTAPGGVVRSWALRYRTSRPDKTTGEPKEVDAKYFLGRDPDMGLAEAREEVRPWRKLAQAGIDLAATKKADKAKRIVDNANTVKALCESYRAAHQSRWSESYAAAVLLSFEKHIYPKLGAIPADQLTRAIASAVLGEIKGPVARHRSAMLLNQALDEAAELGRVPANVVAGLPRVLARRRPASHQVNHARALSEGEIEKFLTALDEFDPLKVWKPARRLLRLALMLGLRGGELRRLEWSDVDLDAARITVPAKLMKGRKAHDSPLPRQAIEILRAQQELTGRSPFVFRSERGGKPMVPAGLNNALNVMELNCSPHDLRATFRTQLVELGYSLDTIRRQQAHSLGAIDDIYDQAKRFETRAAMLQRWADALDRVRRGKPLKDNVIPLHARTG